MYLHVGVAKTGTTYLQQVLFHNQSTLPASGVLVPGSRPKDHFKASLDLRGTRFGQYDDPDTPGTWGRLVDEVHGFPGPAAVLSHETLARAEPEHIAHALATLTPSTVHVVLTVRDLGRQVPAVWQETIKNRATHRFRDFLADIFNRPSSPTGRYFWRAQDVSAVIGRWGGAVDMQHLTVVTVPPPGGARDELWIRFAAAIGLESVDCDLELDVSNVSLGAAEAEWLRRLNGRIDESLPWPEYQAAVKTRLAEQRLAVRSTDARIVVPKEWHDQLRARSEQMITAVQQAGCRVVGDLYELEPLLPEPTSPQPDEVTVSELATMGLDLVRDLLLDQQQAPPEPHPPPLLRLARRVTARMRRG